jgi:hypothetical protein
VKMFAIPTTAAFSAALRHRNRKTSVPQIP